MAPEPKSGTAEQQGKQPRFTAESGLGFMRFIQILNVLTMVVLLLLMLVITHEELTENNTLTVVGVAVSLFSQALIVWMLGTRKRVARIAIPCLYGVQYLTNILPSVAAGGLTPDYAIAQLIIPALISVYFLTSRRAKAVLVNPMKVARLDDELRKRRVMWNPRSADFWMRLAIYFFAFSILGHWMERGLQILIRNGLFPGTLAGPESLTYLDYWNPFPIYGIAVVVCGLALYPLYLKLREKCPHAWQAFAISFVVNGLFCTVAELILGFCFNADLSAWDYSDRFLNFHGQICLLYTMAFAVMSSLITWLLYPYMENLFSYVNKDAFRIIFVLSLVFWIFVYVTYNVDFARLAAGS